MGNLIEKAKGNYVRWEELKDQALGSYFSDVIEPIENLMSISKFLCNHNKCVMYTEENDQVAGIGLVKLSVGWGVNGITKDWGYCHWNLKEGKVKIEGSDVQAREILFKEALNLYYENAFPLMKII